MLSFLKKGCFGLCKDLIILGLITQIFHNVFDIIGLRHFIHHQIEFEVLLTISTILSLYGYFKEIKINDRLNDLYQRFMLVGIFSNLLIATALTVAEFIEMFAEHFGLIQGIIVFLLINAIVSLIYLTFKYKEELEFTWGRTLIYETIFIFLILTVNFSIEFIGYDIVLYIIVISILAYCYKDEIMSFFQKQRTFFKKKERILFEK